MADLGWNLKEVADMVDGTLLGDGNPFAKKIVTDSRQNVEGGLYIALKGDRFDGHSFLSDVASSGAVGALVERSEEGLTLPQIVVRDSLSALHELASVRRSNFGGIVIGITGSSGKTTTRHLVASILSRRFNVHQPIRNFNNHIGVPLTLLELDEKHDAAVLELGCSDFGEIEILTEMVRPHIGLVTNVGPAHLEKLGDLEGVAKAKGELFVSMDSQTTVVVNLDDQRVATMHTRDRKCVTFSSKKDADVRLMSRAFNGSFGQSIAFDIRGEKVEATLPLLGVHNAQNALAAVAVSTAIDIDSVDVVEGLALARSGPGRLSLVKGSGGVIVIDDTYNANPASTRAAISVLGEISSDRQTIAVLGDMLELGDTSEAEHYDIGRCVAESSMDVLITMGEMAKHIDAGAAASGLPDERRHVATDHDSAMRLIRRFSEEESTVLVKGSRGMQMEKIVTGLKEEGS